jgi:tripartite-type tricarboxylate transporter receptor subunit TctC
MSYAAEINDYNRENFEGTRMRASALPNLLYTTSLSLFVACACVVDTSRAQSASAGPGLVYPVKPVRIVTAEVGSGNDLVARAIALSISGNLGQQFIVDNRGFMGSEIAARSAPDGYTLLCYGAPMWLSPFLRARVPWDPLKDFAPVTLTVDTPNILVVHPSIAAKSSDELIALAKAKPGEFNYGASSVGATPHLAAELYKAMTGIHIVRVAYRGSGAALNGLIASQVQIMFPNAGAAMPLVKSNRLRALAVTSLQPSPLAPGLPTLTSSGVPGYQSSSPFGMFAPARTPDVIIKKLNQEIVRVLSRNDLRERLFNAGMEVVAGAPAQLTATMKSEMARWGKLIKDANIREE